MAFLSMVAAAPMPLCAQAESPASAQAEPPDIAPASEPPAVKNSSSPDSSVEEVLVTGTSVTDAIDQARFSESIVDVLSAEDFATTGDSGVVEALSRVTGVTTVGDKYIYVRGLGERYSATLFNNASLPSPDPVRRVIPLDLFPSGVMDQLAVQKTYAPWLPADFAGGSVQLSTRRVPAEREIHFDISLKANAQTTGKKTAWFEGGDADWSGFDDGFRNLPSGLRKLEGGAEPTDPERRDLGLSVDRSFDVNSNETLPPGYEMKGSYANSWKTRIGKLGVIVGGQGENDWRYRTEKRCSSDGRQDCFDAEGGTVLNSAKETRTRNTVEYAGLGGVEWSPATSQLVQATLFWTHHTDKRFDIDDPSYNSESSRFSKEIFAEWEEQSVLTTQLTGNHEIDALGDLSLDWGLTWSQAKREVPDARYYAFDYGDVDDHDGLDPTLYFRESAGNTRRWEFLKDDSWDSVLNLTKSFKLFDMLTTTVKTGGKFFHRDRDSETLRFRYEWHGDISTIYGQPIDKIFDDPRIGPFPDFRSDNWTIAPSPIASDDYTAEEEIGAGYLQLDNEIGEHLRVMAGARYENSHQKTEVAYLLVPVSVLDDDDFYPAVELTWRFNDNVQLRGGWSQTVNRPDLRELAEVVFENPDTRYNYFGNSALTAASLTNYDLRLEWYHGISDSLEIAGFYKEIADPIEELTLPSAVRTRTWKNSGDATLWGIEVAAQQNLGLLGRWADDFTLRTNAAYIDSEVTDDSARAPIATNRKHPLQGQSEWVFNFQITHDYLPWDLKNTLAFNMFGERLSAVGTCSVTACELGLGDLDEYEKPTPTLDYVMHWGFRLFDQDFALTFKAKNLLDPTHEWKRGPYTTRSYSEGQDFTLEIGYAF